MHSCWLHLSFLPKILSRRVFSCSSRSLFYTKKKHTKKNAFLFPYFREWDLQTEDGHAWVLWDVQFTHSATHFSTCLYRGSLRSRNVSASIACWGKKKQACCASEEHKQSDINFIGASALEVKSDASHGDAKSATAAASSDCQRSLLRVSGLFILIYSFISRFVFTFVSLSFAVITILGTYDGT